MRPIIKELYSIGITDFVKWLELCYANSNKALPLEKIHEYKKIHGEHKNRNNNNVVAKDCTGCNPKITSIYKVIKDNRIQEALAEITKNVQNVPSETKEEAERLKKKYSQKQ